MTEQIPLDPPAESGDTAPGTGTAQRPATAPGRARLMRAGAVMASGSIVSRVLGFVRNFLMGMVVGGTGNAVSSAASAANMLPNTVWIFIGGGVLNAILVPAIVRAIERPDRGSDYVSRLMTLVVLCSAVLTAVCIVLVPVLITVTSGRLQGAALTLAVTLGYWMMPQILFSALYVMCGQLLNAHESFGPYQWAPVLNNVVAIIGAAVFLWLWYVPSDPGHLGSPAAWTMPMILTFALTNVAGSAAQVVFLWVYVRRLGLRLRPTWGFRGLGLGTLSKIGLWTLAMLGVAQVGIWATRWASGNARDMAASLGGKNPALAAQYPSLWTQDNAYMVFMIPQGIIAVALVTAAFPAISRSAARGAHDEVLRQYARTSRVLAVPMVLATAVFIALSAPIMWVIIGATGPIAARANSFVLVGYMLGLVPFAATYLVKRVFYAYEDARAPFWMQVPNTLISLVLVWPILAFVDPRWATATATAVSSLGNVLGWALGLWLLRRRARALGVHTSTARATTAVMVKLAVAGVVSLAVGLGLYWLLEDAVFTSRLVAVALCLVIGGVMSAVFAVVAWMLRVEELRSLAEVLGSKLRRRSA